ncbi:MAG: hypothetical protein HYY04_04540 [Chloroflexi bacterium]|nr:hypothetical protein [Chloroflexota bacterium]
MLIPSQIDVLRTRLRGRSKRQLIEATIARSPHEAATEKLILALEVFPLLSLLLAAEHPVRIWLLDQGERPSSAAILNETARQRRWHRSQIGPDDCEGLTDVVGGCVVVVVSWRTLLVMRHEFAHALSTFLSSGSRVHLRALYEAALQGDTFTEDLARESIGEYFACALGYYHFPDLRAELLATDPSLHDFIATILSHAEETSQQLLAPATE